MRGRWYKDAIIYSLDVETFQDGNGDGIGDFVGLSRRIDHLAGLGINCVWLLPFFQTPNRDNGYDVTDYYAVDHRLGTFGDFVEFVRLAGERGMRIIIDLVVNHTSIEHPWFQEARRDPDSPFRDFYVWSEEKPPDADEGMVFPGVQESIWTWDDEAGAYYFHRFYEHQPDLNIANPAVREEIRKIMGFWLQLGVSGFRLDAAPFLIELKGIDDVEASADPYDYLCEFREFLSWRRGDAILLAEANVPRDKVADYFGAGQRLHMLFNFLLNQDLFLALARQEAGPVADALRRGPDIPPSGQWANFLRNHDELDLGRLGDDERQEVFEALAPDPDAHLYGRGIRRRLPPMLDGDPRRLRMAYSLLLSLPGSPVLRYGEEIGMGDDLSLEERTAVRTVMQWSAGRNGGFSPAPPDELVRPVIDEGAYRYELVNVESQRQDTDSLLNWVERAIRARKDCPQFGRGACEVLETGAPAVLAHACTYEGETAVAVHNFCGEPRTAELDFDGLGECEVLDVLGDRSRIEIEDLPYRLELQPYGYRWLRLRPGAAD